MRKVIWLLLLLPQWAMAEEITLLLGTEQFLWEEFDATGGRLLDESGYRASLALRGERLFSENWAGDGSIQLLGGRVLYDGQDSLGNPVTTNTDYLGYAVETGVSFFPSATHPTDGVIAGLRGTLGVAWWERSLLGAGGYDEQYQITYGRLAILFEETEKWRAQIGVKRPLLSAEKVDLSQYGFLNQIHLEPEGENSLYATLEYRLDKRWSLHLALDGYHFGKSDEVRVSHQDGSTYLIHQPKSEMHTIMFSVGHVL